ncbi:MAG: peptidylprolyl isomerase [Acidobacteriota bacterium]|nr:peptidylprolyl isomerase [Acidobacteriota bacterium]
MSSSASTTSVEVTGKPVVRINGTVLTDRDLVREMFAIFPYARVHNGFPKTEEASIRRGAMQMIEYEELVYQEAERRKMVIPAAKLRQAENAYHSKFQSEEEFQQYLKSELGGSMDLYRRQIRRSLLIDKFLKLELDEKSKVSLAEGREFYQKNPAAFRHGEAYAFQTISIMPLPTASAEERKKAEQRAHEAQKQAKATKTFQEFGLLAEKTSEDDFHVNMGDHKMVQASNIPEELKVVIRKMKPGQVSDLLQFGSFYTIVRLNEHVQPGKVSFEEVRDKLMSDLHKTKYDRLRADLDKRLREHAKVEEL